MKDEHDKTTLEIAQVNDAPAQTNAGLAPQGHARMAARKPKRLPYQSLRTPPEGAKPIQEGMPLGLCRSVVPVSVVAREWGISARRVRVMLAEGRLSGRLLPNGYWEVFYPYSYIFGTRGPDLKRQQRQPAKPKNPESMQERQP